MKPVVVLGSYLHPEALQLLETECHVVQGGSGIEDVEPLTRQSMAAAILRSSWQCPGSAMDEMPSVLVVGRPGIGVDNVDVPAASQRGIAVVNVPDGPTVSTAEHALSLLLALAKRHKAAARLLAAGAPLTPEAMSIELRGRVLGLVGLGRVGRALARMCGVGLGMEVVAYDPYVTPTTAAEYGVTMYPELNDVLRAADFVSLHCPADESTRGMIDAGALAMMKPTSYLIDCARGKIVDEAALIAALQAGQIAGAGLDVFDPEPPSPSNPLLALENVVATPHSAGFTQSCLRAIGLGAVEGVLAVLAGHRPPNLVNPDVWDSPTRRHPRGR